MHKRLLYIFILLIITSLGFSQEPVSDSVASPKRPSAPSAPVDSTFVTYTNFHFDSIFLNGSRVIDTSTFNAPVFDPLDRSMTLYNTLSNTGLAHKSMRFSNPRGTGFDMSLPAFDAYLFDDRNMVSYQSVLPYSEVRYVMTTGDKEQHLDFRFGRQFLPRLFVSFGIRSDLSPGVFQNNKSENNNFWLNAHYFTESQRYAVLAYAYRNKLEMQENGGIVDDEAYTSHAESDNSVITTNLTSATNFVKTSGLGIEHYFNLLPQKNATDSVRRFTLGRLTHQFSFQRNRLYYYETSPSASFYQPYDTLLNTTKSTDTTIVQAIRNTLKWSSLGYKKYDNDVPFYLYAGLTHGVFKVKRYDYTEGETVLGRDYQQLMVNGGIIVNLFRSTRITAHADLVTLGYQIGDFDVRGQWKQFLGTTERNLGAAVFHAEIKRQSANWFEESYYSNHFRWDNDFRASTYITFDLRYTFRDYCIGVRQTSIAQYIYFDTDARPAQYDGLFSIREAYLGFRQTLWRFELEGSARMQKASNDDVMHLPLLSGRLKVAYSQPIFHQAATLQPMLTVSYFTKYYADAYMPATHTFFLQNEVEIGNYPFIDLALAIKVKKANLFVAYSNMMLLTGNYNGFVSPHYPMRDSKIFFGVNWRLFN